MNNNKKSLIMTNLVILLPILIGILLWNQLPSQMAVHFDISGDADGYSSKLFVIFAFPILFMLFQLIALASLEKDSVKVSTPPRMLTIYAWIIPFLSLIIQLSIYANALGVVKSSPRLVTAFLGIIFIFIGNYLPKTQRNYTIGIRLPWTLSDEYNWYKTHRLAGKIWFLGGIIILIDSFIQLALPYVLGIVIGVIVIIPMVYSFMLNHRSR